MTLWSALFLLSDAVASAPAPIPVPLPRGTVTIAMATDDDEAPAFAEAVGTSLGASDFLVLPPAGPSRYRARVAVEREVHGLVTGPAAVPGPDVGIGNWGGGVRISLPTRKQDLRALVVTRMTITLVDGRDYRALWTGTAVTAQVGGTPANTAGAVGAKLAGALLSRIPQPLAGPLSVP